MLYEIKMEKKKKKKIFFFFGGGGGGGGGGSNFVWNWDKNILFWHWEWGRISAPKSGDREPCIQQGL